MAITFPRWKSVLGAVAAGGAAMLVAAPPALAQDGGGGPDPTVAPVQERVSAEVRPGVVYLETDVHAYLRNISDGSLLGPYDLSMQCTGFVVNPNGYVATAGHCVSDRDIQEELAAEISQQYAAYGYDAAALYQDAMVNYKVEGTIGGSPADKKVSVSRASDGTSQTPMQAQIVDAKPNAEGDVALLKVNATDLPTIEVAPASAATTGTPVMSIGYPGAVTRTMDPSLEPTYKEGSISSTQNRDGIPFLQITSDMGSGMSGGPTVNQQGQVVGVNSMGTSDRGDSFNFIAPNTALLEMMARNGVPAQAGAFDQAYRAGLDAYYQGHYSDAEEQFARVLDLDPSSTVAAEYRSKAARAYEQFGDEGLGALGWGLIGVGALLVLVAGGAVIVLVRRRRPAGPTAVPAGLPQPGAPQGWTGRQYAQQRYAQQRYAQQRYAQQQYAQQYAQQQFGQSGQVRQYAPPTGAHPYAEQQVAPTGTSRPLPQGYGVPVPRMPGQTGPYAASPGPSVPSTTTGFGTAPYGDAPQSPATGIPAVTTGATREATQVVDGAHAAPGAAPTATAVATPPSGIEVADQAAQAPAGYCPRCGSARTAGDRFCGGCGAGTT